MGYKVVSGDTGTEIAQKLGISFSQLEEANHGVNWNNLHIGEELNTPSHASSGSSGHGGTSAPAQGGDPGTNGDPTVRSYSGPASNFPDSNRWQKFSLMWERDAKVMAINDSQSQIADIKSAIEKVSSETNIDKRAILSMIMQESQGNVHVRTTVSPDGRVRNPGLMQSHNGAEFSNSDPAGSILQMVRDGTEGTKYGDGLKQLLGRYGNIYAAFRGYNSGSVDQSNLSNGLGATNSYVSDIANRLMGAPPN